MKGGEIQRRCGETRKEWRDGNIEVGRLGVNMRMKETWEEGIQGKTIGNAGWHSRYCGDIAERKRELIEEAKESGGMSGMAADGKKKKSPRTYD